MKRYAALLLVMVLVLPLIGCGHEHTWADATCTEPKKCTQCNKTEGEPLGHNWADATCTAPKTCARCGETEGEPLGHQAGSWKEVKEPSFTAKGREEKTCERCGEVIESRTTDKKTVQYNGGKFNFKSDEFIECLEEGLPRYTFQDCGSKLDPLGGHAYFLYESGTFICAVSFVENSAGEVKKVNVWGEHKDTVNVGVYTFLLLCNADPSDQSTQNKLFSAMGSKGTYSLNGLTLSGEVQGSYTFLYITGE